MPDLAVSQEEPAAYGRFGRMRLKYLKAHRRVTYINLKTSGQLTHHLNEIDREANEILRLLIEQMAQAQGITEQLREYPKFCVSCKAWCKIEQKYFKAGAAQAAAAFSTKITALRGDVKGGGVSLRSSRLLTFRLQPVSPACGRQRTPPTVRELCSSPAAFRSTSS